MRYIARPPGRAIDEPLRRSLRAGSSNPLSRHPMQSIFLALASSFASAALPDDPALLAAVPDDAYALVYVEDAGALRSRAERNDWVAIYRTVEGEPVVRDFERELERGTGRNFEGLVELLLELDGEALFFATDDVSGFLAEAPGDRAALVNALTGWMSEAPQRTLEVADGQVQLGTWRDGRSLAFFDHPRALGLYSGSTPEVILGTLATSIGGLVEGEHRAPLVDAFLGARANGQRGIEAFVDFTPFATDAEKALRDAAFGLIPDPSGLLGIDRGTSLHVTADVFPGTRIEMNASLRIPEASLAAKIADTFEPLPTTLPADLPSGTWTLFGMGWNPTRFYETVRAGLQDEDAQGFETVDQGLAAAEAISGVDPVEDVLGQFSGLFAVYHVLAPDESPPTIENGLGLLFGIADGARFLGAIERVLAVAQLSARTVELEGARAYLVDENGPMEQPSAEGAIGGFAVLATRALACTGYDKLVRGVRALARVDGAGVEWGSPLQAAFDENAGAFLFGYAELRHVRAAAFDTEWKADDAQVDPFAESELIGAARRTASGIELRVHTR